MSSQYNVIGHDEKVHIGLGNDIVIKQIKVGMAKEFSRYADLLSKPTWKVKKEVINQLVKNEKNKENRKIIIDNVKNTDLVDLIVMDKYSIGKFYCEGYNFFIEGFDKDMFGTVILDEEDLKHWNEKILSINGYPVSKENPNPEIERFNVMKREMQKAKGLTTDFESMYTSIALQGGYTQEEINNMTFYFFYRLFSRLNYFKDYDTSTLFKTVDSSGNIKIEPWYKPFATDDNDNVRSLDDIKKKTL